MESDSKENGEEISEKCLYLSKGGREVESL